MNNYSPSSQFEQELRAVLAQPGMRLEFGAELRQRLAAAAKARPAARRPRFNRAWATALIAVALLIATVLAIGPQRVLAQVLEWLRYVPGIGFVDSEGGLRVLAEPVSQTIDGITISIEEGLIDSEFTWLTFHFDGIRAEQKPTSENDPGCFATPQILLPNGSSLSIIGGTGGGGPTWMREEFNYLALPRDVNEARVIVACVPEVISGAGPENIEFAIRFVPAPEDFEALPVQQVPTATTPAEAQPYDMQLIVDEFVELQDAYLFRGRFSWEDSAYPNTELWDFQLALNDAQGNKLPIQLNYEQGYTEPLDQFLTWTAQTEDKNINGPVTFSLAEISVRKLLQMLDENSFEINITEPLETNQIFPVNAMIELDGSLVLVKEIKYESYQADSSHWLFLTIQVNPDEITNVSFLDTFPFNGNFAGGPAGQNEVFFGLGYDQPPVGAHQFWVDNFFVRLAGPWTTAAEVLAADPNQATPTPEPAACLTEQSWQTLLSQAAPDLPDSFVDARLLVQGPVEEGLFATSLFLTSPTGENVVTVGPGGRADISPDGKTVLYEHQDIWLFDVKTRQSNLLIDDDYVYGALWSPDGSRLAFIRGNDGVYVSNTDGSNPQRLAGSNANMIAILGWMPDGNRLIVSTIGEAGAQAQMLDIESGQATTFFAMDDYKNGLGILSPDGSQIAFLSEVFGNMQPGIYVANLDGTQKRLIAEPGSEIFFLVGAWRPAGDWFIVNPYDSVSFKPEPLHPLAVNVVTCEVILLNQILGTVIDWH